MIKSILGTDDKTAHKKTAEENLFEGYKMLTKGEKRVFELAANQKSTEEIAEELGKSSKTVRNQFSLIYQKLQISSRTELVTAEKTLGVVL